MKPLSKAPGYVGFWQKKEESINWRWLVWLLERLVIWIVHTEVALDRHGAPRNWMVWGSPSVIMHKYWIFEIIWQNEFFLSFAIFCYIKTNQTHPNLAIHHIYCTSPHPPPKPMISRCLNCLAMWLSTDKWVLNPPLPRLTPPCGSFIRPSYFLIA